MGDVSGTARPANLYEALGLTPEQIAEHKQLLRDEFARIAESEYRAWIATRDLFIR